jgi:amino acid adenylation domain-containing protein
METPLAFDLSEIEASIDERFGKVARRFAGRPAVVEHGRVTTYAELDRAASGVARALRERLDGAPGPVALLLEAGAPLFAAMLGTLRAGRFYVPLDPAQPEPRLRTVWENLDAAVLVADGPRLELARRLAGSASAVWDAGRLAPADESAGTGAAGPDDLAYVLFTSGSTGIPKGVIQTHRNVLHNVWKLSAALRITPEDRLTLLASPSVGASVSDLFGAFFNGAAIAPYALSGDGLRRLPEFLAREGITVYHSVPSVFRTLAATFDGAEDLSRVRVVRLGGEPVIAADHDFYRHRFARSCVFLVGYGATEINVIRQWSAGRDTPWPGGSPLGYPVEGTEVVLLDDEGRPTDGPGEIAVRARTLSPGYWKDPERTAAAFRPVEGSPGLREYRTGDLGTILPDGCLLHLGRRDDRLKIRGHGVELADVEAALRAIPGVREAVAGRRGPAAAPRLAAWVVRDRGFAPDAAALRRALSSSLPAALVPTAFVFLDALPRAASGKLDRGALPEPSSARPELEAPFREPDGSAEAAAAAAFREVLGLDRVGADDDFFDLGGDSLSAVELLAVLGRSLGRELTAADLLEAPTPAGLAARTRPGAVSPEGGLVRLGGDGGRPVFVVPGGAGDREDLFTARRVARATGGGFRFLCFRSGPLPHPPVAELAERFLTELRAEAPRGPYALVGDCVGGIVAFAMARRLRAEGEEVALLALLDAPYPTAGKRSRGWALRHASGVVRLFERIRYFRRRVAHHAHVVRDLRGGRTTYLRRLGRVGAAGIAADGGVARRSARAHRDSYAGSALTWSPRPFDGPVLVVESEESARRGHAERWTRLASGGEVLRVPGDHAGFIVDHAPAVGNALRRALEAAGPV